jgi:hypothetical protein
MMPGDVQVVEPGPDFVTIWHVTPPAQGATYRVVRDMWERRADETDFRHIYQWVAA